MSDRHEMQAAGTHPAPCARHCEATAFEIEIRRLRSEVTRLSSMLDHQRDEAIETERMLRAELGARCARETKLRTIIADNGHAMTFQSLGQYRTALLRALAEGAQR